MFQTFKDGRDIVICYLLSSVILPTFKKNLAKKKGEKNIWKPSILESRQAFIVHAQVPLHNYVFHYLFNSILFYRTR